MDVTTLRGQHKELLSLSSKVGTFLSVEGADCSFRELRNAINELFTALSEHLELEDEWLYPVLLRDSDDEVRATARVFQSALGKVSYELANHKERWPVDSEAECDPDEFRRETFALLAHLKARIAYEEAELYLFFFSFATNST